MYYINRNGGIKGALKKISYGTNNTLSYTYDAVGRIKAELKNGVLNREYEYDSMGQLTAEYLYDPAIIALYTDDTTVDRIKLYYIYNINGNLEEQGCNKEWLDESGNATTANLSLNTYGYHTSEGNWLSPLMYDGNEEIAYDSMGNPLNYFGKNFTWENGRELASITSSSGASIASYEYDASGLRISKTTTAGGNVYYVYDENSNLIFEKHPDYTLAFYYDGNGTRTHFTKKSSTGYETYYYSYNLQGDIIALLNNAGTVVAEYNYTAYGKPIGAVTEIGNLNPFRYRGYYYDDETGFYYLQSRYYDPTNARFINADAADYIGATGTPLSFNLFLYCENDPVNNTDPSGNFWVRAASAVAGAALFGTIAYLISSLFNLPRDLKLGVTATFAVIGGVLGGIFGPTIIAKALPKLTKWLKEIKRTTKIIKPKGENLGGIVIMNKVRIMLHLPHLKNPRNPHKYLHLQIEFLGFKWRIRLGRNVI